MLDIVFAPLSLPRSGALALLVGEDEAPSGLLKQVDEATGGAVTRALEAASFKPGKGKSCSILAPGAGLSRVLVIGLGKSADRSGSAIEEAGGSAAAALAGESEAAIATEGLSGAQAALTGFGAALRAYRFDRYRTKEKAEDKPKLATLTVLTDENAAATAEWTRLKAVAGGIFLTRDLVSEPPNVLIPAELARRCETLRELGIAVEVIERPELVKLGFGALLGVAQGSSNEPRVVIMRWNGPR